MADTLSAKLQAYRLDLESLSQPARGPTHDLTHDRGRGYSTIEVGLEREGVERPRNELRFPLANG